MPLPDGPTIAAKAPVSSANETSRSTASGRPPLRYSLDSVRATSMGLQSEGSGRRSVRRLGTAGGAVPALLVALAAACAGGEAAPKDSGGATATPSGSGEGVAAAPNGAGTAAAATGPLRVVFVGTSLTAGLGLDPDSAYPALIQRKADSAGVPIAVVNAGVSGETSAGALRRIDWVLREPLDVLVLETGANDGLRALRVDSTRENLAAIVARTRQTHPGARVVIVQMEAPPNLGPDYTGRFRAMFPEVARAAGATLTPFLLDRVAGVGRLNQGDGIHPNEAGARIVAETVWRTLRPVLDSARAARASGG